MVVGWLCRPGLVQECPARHCFLSLPRHWAPHPHAPTFQLEGPGGRGAVLWWGGDLHGEEGVVLVGGEVLRGCGLQGGQEVLVRQVPVPPPCRALTVVVASLAQWQDLALNQDLAQASLLDQVRVVAQGQQLPLWLEGGALVSLQVTALQPPGLLALLQPLTEVEVLPPSEGDPLTSLTPVTFSNNDASLQHPSNESAHTSLQHPTDDSTTHLHPATTTPQHPTKCTSRAQGRAQLLAMLVSVLWGRRGLPGPAAADKREVCPSLGLRVVPRGDAWLVRGSTVLARHPALVVVSRNSLPRLPHSHQVSFLATIRRINSPKDISEKQNKSKEKVKEATSKEMKQADGVEKVSGGQHSDCEVCTVLVWENYVQQHELGGEVEELSTVLGGGGCLVSGGLRRLMGLHALAVVQLSTAGVRAGATAVQLDLCPLFPVKEGQLARVIQHVVRLLRELVEHCPVVIGGNTVVQLGQEEGGAGDVVLRTRDGAPLCLDARSVPLLQLVPLVQPPSLPYILPSLQPLDGGTSTQPRLPYVGAQDSLTRLQQHILLGLGLLVGGYHTPPQFALLQGSRGSGKTSLMENLVASLAGSPHHLHCQVVSLKQLRGKRVEAMERMLRGAVRQALFHRPAVIFLDDLDHFAPSLAPTQQEAGPAHDHTLQAVTMLAGLLQELEQLAEQGCSVQPGRVMVVASCCARTSVHPLLVEPQGQHYFPCTISITALEGEGRCRALAAMLHAHLNPLAMTDPQTTADLTSVQLELDPGLVSRLTESFKLPDLSHVALRTFLHGKQRWQSEEERQEVSSQHPPVLQEVQRVMERGAAPCDRPWPSFTITHCDFETALRGYTPLSLRGLTLSEKASPGTVRLGGLREARQTLEETLTWPSLYPGLFCGVGLRLRSGVLLYGPPGCGKTLLASSVTSHCHLNFITVKGPELLSKYIGASEEAVRSAFERASAARPCVLFFDEFESVAPRRGHDSTGVTDRVVNQLLTQMDGVEGLAGVYVLAATSRPDLIDPALLRPGRLDKCVFCPMPSLEDRQEILEALSQDLDLGEPVDWREVAQATPHFTGADLQSLLSTAQVLVAQETLGDSLYQGVVNQEPTTEGTAVSYSFGDVSPTCEEDSAVGAVSCQQSQTQSSSSPSLVQDTHNTAAFRKVRAETEVCENSCGVAAQVPGEDIVKEAVVIQKGRDTVKYSHKKVSVMTAEAGHDPGMITVQDEGSKEATSEAGSCAVINSPDKTGREEVSAGAAEVWTRKQGLQVCRRHIESALKEVRPSVTQAECSKYQRLYATFSRSREGGNFGQPTPGERATLA